MLLFLLLTFAAAVNTRSVELADKSIKNVDQMLLYREKRVRRHAVKDEGLLWNSKEIPYEFDSDVSEFAKMSILKAIDLIEKNTCIRFKPHESTDKHFVKFINGEGCWSHIGRRVAINKDYQELTLTSACLTKVIILHELLHLLGFYHEHTRPDRDNYINVLWDNINPENDKVFEHVSPSVGNILGDYDYNSVMHYGNFAYSKNGKRTLEAKGDPTMKLGSDGSLSSKDIEKIKKLYHCREESSLQNWSKWSKWGECMGDGKQKRFRHCRNFDASLCSDRTQNGFQIQRRSC